MNCTKLANTVLVCTKSRVWDINKTNDGLGSNVCLVILFIHAILVVILRQC